MTAEEKTAKLADLKTRMIPADIKTAAGIVGKSRQNMAAFVTGKRPFKKQSWYYVRALEIAIGDREFSEARMRQALEES